MSEENKFSPDYLSKIDKIELFSGLCREDFYFFVQEFWGEVIPEDPVWNWHIKFLCDELQKIAERVFKGLPKRWDEIINIPPGTTKSTICSVMFPAWIWTRMPSARIIGASCNGGLAEDLARKTRIILKSRKYQSYFPEVKIAPDCDGKRQIANTLRGERYAVGVNGGVIGRHCHFIIVDDPLDPKANASDLSAAIPQAKHFFDEVIPTRKVNKEISVMLVIMQRLHEDDPTGHLLAKAKNDSKKKIRHICLPATTEYDIYPEYLKKFYVDGFLDPVRLNAKALDEMTGDMTPYAIAGQIGQSPVPRGGGEFDISQIMVHEAPTHPIVDIVRYWDKAGTQGSGCYTAGPKMGIDTQGRFWILDMRRGQWRSDIRNRMMKETAKVDGFKVRIGIEQEGGSGGKESAENTVKQLAGWTVIVDVPRGNKDTRAEPFSIQVNIGNVSMVKGAWNQDFLHEMEYWPNSKYKDQIDACSGAFALLTRKKTIKPFA